MRIEKSLENISDGQLYDINSIVKASANGCNGCSACCHNVGDLIELNPYDVYRLMKVTSMSFDQLLVNHIDLRTENKISLPYLSMKEGSKACSFLVNERCSIHSHRPNICRLFPLGRAYIEDDFKYFLQVGACCQPELSEIQVKEWLSIDLYNLNKDFILNWYRLIKALKFRVKFVYDHNELQDINRYLLKVFYSKLSPSDEEFYKMFNEEMFEAKKYLGLI